jgi:hypothetical protein
MWGGVETTWFPTAAESVSQLTDARGGSSVIVVQTSQRRTSGQLPSPASVAGRCSMADELHAQPHTPRTARLHVTREDALQHAFYPLTLPITVGPGCISVAITLGAHLRHQAGPGFEHGYPRHFLAALIGMFLLCLLVWVCYGNAGRLVKMLGKSGTTIVTRLSAFILMAIRVQIVCNGISSGIHGFLDPILKRLPS